MRTGYTNYAIVLGLIVATGLAAVAVRPQGLVESTIPPVSKLASGTGWSVTDTYASTTLHYRQWQLKDQAGHEALLYIGVTTRSLPALAWTGTLGYQGAGYEVAYVGEQRITLSDGSLVTVNSARVNRLLDDRLLLYAIASPHGVMVHRLASFTEAAWDAIGGDRGPYFLVRVSVPVSPSERTATQSASTLLGVVLPRLVADAQNP
jgi:hypothetical protein